MDDYRRLRKIYPRVIRLCEARGLTQPWMLPFEDLQGDPELTWAAYVAQSSIHGHPGNESEPMTYVAPAPLGGAVDESLSELSADIDTLLETESVARRVAKLRGREGVDGRELFVAVAASGVSFSVYYELLDPQALPAVPLHAAQGIDRVWIATGTSAVVSWTTAENWRLHRMPDALRAVAG